jgi:hypothetical protein
MITTTTTTIKLQKFDTIIDRYKKGMPGTISTGASH